MIVLAGGRDFFSNGIHLNLIEASHLVIAALEGDVAAGGVPLALAADRMFGPKEHAWP